MHLELGPQSCKELAHQRSRLALDHPQHRAPLVVGRIVDILADLHPAVLAHRQDTVIVKQRLRTGVRLRLDHVLEIHTLPQLHRHRCRLTHMDHSGLADDRQIKPDGLLREPLRADRPADCHGRPDPQQQDCVSQRVSHGASLELSRQDQAIDVALVFKSRDVGIVVGMHILKPQREVVRQPPHDRRVIVIELVRPEDSPSW